ncbi:sigma-70 family RNA polymerase sigma factor [Salinispora arenicola]|uniref:RNA polymerase sigma factor n=2 Tax=Salinispora arenicola TaxID=168697 RepID=A0A542XR97_SALAC|nr:sigma-70 family RNA polymerase sigma factor [Salinispora arenicola]NIL59769.1 sigma-70 family RNA polymerase sigma factor [Salinispora arenicola]NIL61046.1 sigma-70 family RNA polymerase sigma factor [Salinispora arenicola]TQL38376.1 RNA polymerase sigma-70 factor (ECF subfamily) [Salinispora arenicola]GIM85419.1 RNA polymerase sigma factor [Salinispora arenicola]
MTDDTEVTSWALEAGRGDRDAAAAFVRATQQQVRRFLAALVSPVEADDLAQETYLRALRSLPSFAGRSSARTWLFSIARRVAVDHVRAATSRPRTIPMADSHDVADADGSGFDRQVALEQLIAALPADRREAFVVTQVLGLSYAEAAEVCGCPVGTIRSRVFRAREDLVVALETRSGGSSDTRDTAVS